MLRARGSLAETDFEWRRVVARASTRIKHARIFGPKQDGSYRLEMRQSDRQSLVVSVPASEAAVLRYFQTLKTNGFVPQLWKRLRQSDSTARTARVDRSRRHPCSAARRCRTAV